MKSAHACLAGVRGKRTEAAHSWRELERLQSEGKGQMQPTAGESWNTYSQREENRGSPQLERAGTPTVRGKRTDAANSWRELERLQSEGTEQMQPTAGESWNAYSQREEDRCSLQLE